MKNFNFIRRADEKVEAFFDQHRTIGFFFYWRRIGYWVILSVFGVVLVVCEIIYHSRTGQFINLPGLNK